MALTDINLDDLANDVHNDSYGDHRKNMVYDPETGKWLAVPEGEPVEGVITNGMTREGFAL